MCIWNLFLCVLLHIAIILPPLFFRLGLLRGLRNTSAPRALGTRFLLTVQWNRPGSACSCKHLSSPKHMPAPGGSVLGPGTLLGAWGDWYITLQENSLLCQRWCISEQCQVTCQPRNQERNGDHTAPFASCQRTANYLLRQEQHPRFPWAKLLPWSPAPTLWLGPSSGMTELPWNFKHYPQCSTCWRRWVVVLPQFIVKPSSDRCGIKELWKDWRIHTFCEGVRAPHENHVRKGRCVNVTDGRRG